MKILLISGSLRKQSVNTQMMNIAKSLLENNNQAEVRILDWSKVPMFNQDIENPAPEAVQECRDAFLWADGVWFFTPEYNGMIPGPLKNLLDWMSRPLDPSKGYTSALTHQNAAICGVAGRSGSANSSAMLETLLKRVGMKVYDHRIHKSLTAKQLAESDLAGFLDLEVDLGKMADDYTEWLTSRNND